MVPADQEPMVQKAFTRGADVVIFDVEDGVPPNRRPAAYEHVRRVLSSLSSGEHLAFVRIRSFAEGGREDLDAIAPFGCHRDALAQEVRTQLSPLQPDPTDGARIHVAHFGVCIPKVESARDIQTVTAHLETYRETYLEPHPEAHPELRLEARRETSRETPGEKSFERQNVSIVPLLAMIESPAGVLAVQDILRSHPWVVGVALGGEDFLVEMGVFPSNDGLELLVPRANVALAARALGRVAIDTVYTRYRDSEGLKQEAERSRQLGFHGKLVIHPGQIPVVHEVFSPGEEAVSWARRVVSAASNQVDGQTAVFVVDGEMVDAPVLQRARAILRAVGDQDRS